VNGDKPGVRLTDELGERLGLVVDGVDGRVHHVAFGSEAMANAEEPPLDRSWK